MKGVRREKMTALAWLAILSFEILNLRNKDDDGDGGMVHISIFINLKKQSKDTAAAISPTIRKVGRLIK